MESVLMRWMNLEPIIHSEVSQKDKYHILTHILHGNLECQVHESRQIGSGQTSNGKIARVYIDILGICKLKWTGMGEFNSDDHYIYYCGQESLKRNGVQNAVPGCTLKNDRMISVRFQGKPFNITVIQVYAPTSNTEEAEVERVYEDLQELTPKKRYPFHYRGLEYKSRNSRNTLCNR